MQLSSYTTEIEHDHKRWYWAYLAVTYNANSGKYGKATFFRNAQVWPEAGHKHTKGVKGTPPTMLSLFTSAIWGKKYRVQVYGTMNMFMVFQKALTKDEIKRLYKR